MMVMKLTVHAADLIVSTKNAQPSLFMVFGLVNASICEWAEDLLFQK
jgi:hypothetical protein